jgi:glycosyltransferase involved in cell wall biosynthesis
VLVYFFSAKAADIAEKNIVIVTASYNNKDWYKQNLDSVFVQKYQNYRLIYIDDCPPDGTYELVKEYVEQKRRGIG